MEMRGLIHGMALKFFFISGVLLAHSVTTALGKQSLIPQSQTMQPVDTGKLVYTL